MEKAIQVVDPQKEKDPYAPIADPSTSASPT